MIDVGEVAGALVGEMGGASAARRLLERPADGELSMALGRGRFRLGWGVGSGVGGRWEWPCASAKVVVERSVPAL